jgi:hypothetical protein
MVPYYLPFTESPAVLPLLLLLLLVHVHCLLRW